MKKVLVANRGEIACRVIRSCKDRGIATVAIYSDADAGALHVRAADEAIRVGLAKPSESYLNVPAILEAARTTGAHAIHPCYGFLAENADFARAVETHRLLWIGPRPDQIEAMGDKERSRRIAVAAGVPVLPGSERFRPGEATGLAAAAATTGFPLLVKACGGGGGIGMRVVRRPEDLEATVATTQGLAERSFGDASVFLERYVDHARHIEIQVFGDGEGRAIHLFERDCSVQRRFQKIVEESPAPGLKPEIFSAMAAAAVSLAAAVDYRSAGTVEFVVDALTQEFFFLEMNTRIQVEHPVTEAITGLDLIGLQLDLAFSPDTFRLPTSVERKGHAIEVRLCAENPAKMFLPSPGRLAELVFPPEHDGLRIDTGVSAGDTITPYYDSMIAKIIAHAATRDEALARLAKALRHIELGDFVSNRDFLLRVLEHPQFRSGRVQTNFVDQHKDALLAPPASRSSEAETRPTSRGP